MIFLNPDYGIEINLNDPINVIYIENPKAFSNALSQLWNQCNGGDGNWQLIDKEDGYSIPKKLTMITSPIELDCNDKKILKTLYSEIEQCANELFIDETASIKAVNIEYIDKLIEYQQYPLVMDYEVPISELLKIYDVRFDMQGDTMVEKVLNYIKLYHRILKINCFVFVNLKAYISETELVEMYKDILYEDVKVILVESKYDKKLMYEKVRIYDQDSCIIDI